MLDPRPLSGWAVVIAVESTPVDDGLRDCGRARAAGHCNVLAVCCRPVDRRRYDWRNALATVNGDRFAGSGPWLHVPPRHRPLVGAA